MYLSRSSTLGGASSGNRGHIAPWPAKDGPTSYSHSTMAKRSAPKCFRVLPNTPGCSLAISRSLQASLPNHSVNRTPAGVAVLGGRFVGRRLPYSLELMKLAAALVLASALGNSEAQPLPLEMQLPDWAMPRWERIAKESSLKLSGRLNPFLQRGDFDGDGKPDLALFVESTKSGKYGIAVIHASDRQPSVLFVGKRLGNGGDSLDWVDIWNVQGRGSLQHGKNGTRYRLALDTLLLVKESSASALLLFGNGQFKWRQQGD